MAISPIQKARRVNEAVMGRARGVDPVLALQVSSAGLILALAGALSTVLPGAPYFPDAVVFFVIPTLGILINFRTVSLLTPLRHPREFGFGWLKRVTAPLPRYTGWIYAGFFLFAWTVMMVTMLRHTGGAPTELHGQFYLNNHGSLTPVSHSEYVDELLRWQRVFLLGSACFLGIASITNWAVLRSPETFFPQLDQPG